MKQKFKLEGKKKGWFQRKENVFQTTSKYKKSNDSRYYLEILHKLNHVFSDWILNKPGFFGLENILESLKKHG